MGIVLRQSIYTSIISYAGVLIGYVNLMYLYPKFLTPEQVGLLRAITDAAMLFVPFAAIGLAHGVARFFPRYSKTPGETNAFVALIVGLAMAGFTIFLLVVSIFQQPMVEFFSEKASDVVPYKNLIIGLTFILLFTTIFEQLSKSILKVAFPNFLSQVVVRILQAVAVFLYYSSILTFHEFVVANVIVYAITVIVLMLFLYQNKISISFQNMSQFSFERIKDIMKFSSLSFVSASAMILIGKMDSIMVTGLLGLSEVALYTTAYYMATVIEIPKRAITQTAAPLIAQSFEKEDHAQVLQIYRKAALHQFIIGALLMIGIWANLENIFMIMPKGEFYRAGAQVVILVGLAKLLDMVFGPNSEVIGFSKHYWFNLASVTLLAVIIVICNYLLIPRFGIVGAAYGTILALVTFNVVKLIFIYAKLQMQPFTKGTLIVLAISSLTVALNLMLPRVGNVFLDILYRSTFITIAFSSLIIASKCSHEINTMFWKIMRRVGLMR